MASALGACHQHTPGEPNTGSQHLVTNGHNKRVEKMRLKSAGTHLHREAEGSARKPLATTDQGSRAPVEDRIAHPGARKGSAVGGTTQKQQHTGVSQSRQHKLNITTTRCSTTPKTTKRNKTSHRSRRSDVVPQATNRTSTTTWKRYVRRVRCTTLTKHATTKDCLSFEDERIDSNRVGRSDGATDEL
jgi:hypothetical protein